MSDLPIERPGVRRGYDLWAQSYDATPNPVVALDRRVTPGLIAPRAGERILDAGCGSGRHLLALEAAGADAVGIDFSLEMLRVARSKLRQAALVQADLLLGWPVRAGQFDAGVCALVGEHLDDLEHVCREMWRVLRPGGRAIFSVYHPAMAEAGKEANFRRDGVEYRLGAERHTLADYLAAVVTAGFAEIEHREHVGDVSLIAEAPSAARYVGLPLLLTIVARRRSASEP